MFEYDKISKWYIQNRGDSILRMVGVRDIDDWKPLPAELVLPRQLPDGVLSVLEHGRTEPDIYILEIATYPDARVPSQAVRDTALGLLERWTLPEVVVLFLHKKGNVPAARSVELTSRKGFTRMKLWWRAVKLWELAAEELLALGDVALLPWAPLAKFSEPPETIVSRCRARIDQETPSPGREDLLTVAQFLPRLRYDEERLLQRLPETLGGREAMIQSPLYQEIVEEAKREGATEAMRQDILDLLEVRFGPQAKDLDVELKAVGFDRLRQVLRLAATCRSLASFRKQLLSL
jgi:predicted transposase YdaD